MKSIKDMFDDFAVVDEINTFLKKDGRIFGTKTYKLDTWKNYGLNAMRNNMYRNYPGSFHVTHMRWRVMPSTDYNITPTEHSVENTIIVWKTSLGGAETVDYVYIRGIHDPGEFYPFTENADLDITIPTGFTLEVRWKTRWDSDTWTVAGRNAARDGIRQADYQVEVNRIYAIHGGGGSWGTSANSTIGTTIAVFECTYTTGAMNNIGTIQLARNANKYTNYTVSSFDKPSGVDLAITYKSTFVP